MKKLVISLTEIEIFTFALCMLLHLLYLKPTHALILNTLSHPHFETLKLFKKMFCKNINKKLFLMMFLQNIF
jgi:hypothetical protein